MNCPLGEDEELCDLKHVFCPQNCECVAYAAHCVSGQPYEWSLRSFSPFLVLYLTKSNIPNDIETPFMSEIHISESKNDFNNLCHWLKHAIMLKYVSITFTKINNLEQHCFSQTKHLKFCDISNTNIQHVVDYSFSMLFSLAHINLSSNPIQWISAKAFHFLPCLRILSLLNISTFEVSFIPFLSLNFKLLETNIASLCCIVSEGARCSLDLPLHFSCSQILENLALRIVCILVSISAFVLNVLSILTQCKTNKKAGPFVAIMNSLNVGNMLLSFPLVMLWIADIIYKRNFAVRQEAWQSSLTCLLVFGLFLASISVSIFSSSFMALARLMVVKYPLESKFKDQTFVKQRLSFWLVASAFGSTLLSALQWLLSFLNYGQLSVLCTPFYDPTNTSAFLKVLTCTISIAFFSSVVVFYICSGTLWTALEKYQQKVRRALTKATARKSILGQVSVLGFSNSLCWGTTSVICLMLALHKNYPVLMMFWTTVAVLPTNSIVKPSIFIVLSFKRRLGF